MRLPSGPPAVAHRATLFNIPRTTVQGFHDSSQSPVTFVTEYIGSLGDGNAASDLQALGGHITNDGSGVYPPSSETGVQWRVILGFAYDNNGDGNFAEHWDSSLTPGTDKQPSPRQLSHLYLSDRGKIVLE